MRALSICVAACSAALLCLAGCGPEPLRPEADAPPIPASDCPNDAATAAFELTLPFANNGLIYGFQGCLGAFRKADAPEPGMVIKGGGPVLYYYASNHKRYRFPTTRELASWFGPLSGNGLPLLENDPAICSRANELPDAAIESIPLGGNVTLRPGAYAVGLVSDQTLFLVGRGGALHRVAPEVGLAIYPDNLYGRLRYLPDVFFVGYDLGSEVRNAAQFDPEEERTESTIEQDGIKL